MHRQYKCFGRPVRYISMNAMVGAIRGPLMNWARVLAYVTGTVDQELLARNEYLAVNRRRKLTPYRRAILTPYGDAAPCGTVAISCTIGTPNTLGRSGPSLPRVRSNRWRCLPAVRT